VSGVTRLSAILTGCLLALLAGAAAAPAAHAAEGFVGITTSGSSVRFTSQAPTAFTRPARVRGLDPGERILALAGSPSGLVAVGSTARLYRLDDAGVRARRVGAPFATGLRGTAFSLAVEPGGARARMFSDVGQDVLIDLATGAATPGPGLRLTTGEAVAVAASFRPDGRLVGVDRPRRRIVEETAPGSNVLAVRAATPRIDVTVIEPFTFLLAQDGRGYFAVGGRYARSAVQSYFQKLDLATGRAAPERSAADNAFLGAALATFGSVGTVPDDRRLEGARVGTPPRRVSLRALVAGSFLRSARVLGLTVSADEAFNALARLRVGGRTIATLGTAKPFFGGTEAFGVGRRAEAARALARVVGRRVRVRVEVEDLLGNRRVFSRSFTLVR
jgi:hypothetical protein